MKLRIDIRYPEQEVTKLVAFALDGMDHSKIIMDVKDAPVAYVGLAYPYVPTEIADAVGPGYSYYVSAKIGPAVLFPCTNIVTVGRRKNLPKGTTVAEAEEARLRLAESLQEDVLGKIDIQWAWSKRAGTTACLRWQTRQPYGGKDSPLIEVNNWREAVITLVTHEGYHCEQFRDRPYRQGHRRHGFESDCEWVAYGRLEEYRRTIGA
jgi:hypothetical protein